MDARREGRGREPFAGDPVPQLARGAWRPLPSSPLILLVVLMLLPRLGCDGAESRDPADVLARVGEDVIRTADFQAELERRAGRQPIDAGSPEVRERILDEMIDSRAQLARARDLHLDHDPIVRREIEALLVRHLRARELAPRLQQIRISEDEIERHLAANEDDFARPARVRAAIVELDLPAAASGAARDRRRVEAAALLEEATRLPASFHGFGPIAARASSHRASRYKGGDIGWLVRGELRHPFESALLEAIFALETPGELAPIVEGARALYLVRLLESAPREVAPLDRVAPRIRQRLFEQRQEQAERDWLTILRARTDVERDLERLGALELPPALTESAAMRRSPPPGLPGG